MSRQEMVLRRRQQVFQQKVVILILTACIIICGVLLGSSIASAGKSKASSEHAAFKYYTSIEIEKGDTLWSIANTYMSPEYNNVQEYIAEVKELNQIGEDSIHTGQYITIPYYSNEFR